MTSRQNEDTGCSLLPRRELRVGGRTLIERAHPLILLLPADRWADDGLGAEDHHLRLPIDLLRIQMSDLQCSSRHCVRAGM